MSKVPECKECLEEGQPNWRPVTGIRVKRCVTHIRAKKTASKKSAHGARVERTYGITSEEYWAIYELQGGVCAICRRATGKTKRLSVDHDHKTGEVRSLCCSPCNQMLGHARDNPEMFYRAMLYLIDPPGRNYLDGN